MVPPSPASARSPAAAASRKKRNPTSDPADPPTGGIQSGSQVDVQQHYRYIAEAAYYIAERRGFSGGCELDDWLQAEKQIAQLLSAAPGKSH